MLILILLILLTAHPWGFHSWVLTAGVKLSGENIYLLHLLTQVLAKSLCKMVDSLEEPIRRSTQLLFFKDNEVYLLPCLSHVLFPGKTWFAVCENTARDSCCCSLSKHCVREGYGGT